MLEDFTPHQQKIIKRYYNNQGPIQLQRLAELVTELYLAEGKKRERAWALAATAMQKLEVPQSRIKHLLQQDNPAPLAELVKELEAGR
jgi:exonuclease VII small subunit